MENRKKFGISPLFIYIPIIPYIIIEKDNRGVVNFL
jgi:hypothetical protein